MPTIKPPSPNAASKGKRKQNQIDAKDVTIPGVVASTKSGSASPGNTAPVPHIGQVKTKDEMKCGEGGTYGDLKKKTGHGKYDRDHIPSKAALKARAAKILRRPLKEHEKKAIDNAGLCIVIPVQAHKDHSPTHSQSAAAAKVDSADLQGSAKRDVDSMLNPKKKNKGDETPKPLDPKCKKAYKKEADKILKITNDEYDSALKKVVKNAVETVKRPKKNPL